LGQLALRGSVPVERLARLEALAVDAVARVAAGRGGFGVLLDGTHGAAALRDAERAKLWLAQPVERPASRPLEFEAASLAGRLEPQPGASAWERCAAVIAANDEYCRGVLVCGLDEPPERIARSLALAAAVPLVRGLVAGGSILTGGAQAWLAGEKSDETTTVEIAARFAALVEVWSTVRDPRLDRAERSAN